MSTPFNFMPSYLRREILEKGIRQSFPANMEILKAGQFVKAVPFVLSGLIKVYAQFDEKDLLLYYIQAEESCIMSFTAIIENSPSQVYAVTEKPTETILIPTDLVQDWTRRYPAFNLLYFQQYHQRYDDLIQTISHLVFDNTEQRLLHYLREQADLKQTAKLNLHHREIARDLGTAREVVSRLLKKLEKADVVRQVEQGWIEIL